jgi:hypothetical protein
MNRKTIAAAGMLAALGAASPAWAGGFLADMFVRPFNPELARKLDRWHHDAGEPLTHAANSVAGVAADAVVPGSGTAVRGALEAREAMRRARK